MPFSYEIEPDARLVRVSVTGETTEEERDDIARTIIADPRFAPGLRILIDRTQARDVGDLVRVERMMVRLGTLVESIRGSKIAYVGGRPAQYGMGRLAESYVSITQLPIDFRPFASRAEAEEWLMREE